MTTTTPNFDAIAAKIAAKKAELRALMDQFNARLKVEFADATKFFFAETNIEAVIWNQYTPSFNDGEPCEFTRSGAVFITRGFDVDDLMSADNYEDDELYGTIPYSYWDNAKSRNPHDLSYACKNFNDLLNSITDILESMYGNYGTTVYLTRDHGSLEAEYDCGY